MDLESLVRLFNLFFIWWIWDRESRVYLLHNVSHTSALCCRWSTDVKIVGVSVAVIQLSKCASMRFHCARSGFNISVPDEFLIYNGGQGIDPVAKSKSSVARRIFWNWLRQMMKFVESSFTVMKECRFEIKRFRLAGKDEDDEEAMDESTSSSWEL